MEGHKARKLIILGLLGILLVTLVLLISANACLADEGDGENQEGQQIEQTLSNQDPTSQDSSFDEQENSVEQQQEETKQLDELKEDSQEENIVSRTQNTTQDTSQRPTVTLEKSASPSTVSYGDPVTVTLTARGTGAPRPMDIALVLDKSASLGQGEPAPGSQNIQNGATLYDYAIMGSVVGAAVALALDSVFPGYGQVAILSFDGNSSPSLDCQLTNSFDEVMSTLVALGDAGTTAFDSDGLAGAINVAASELQGARRIPGSLMFLGLITDGCPGDADTAAAIAAAQNAKDAGIQIYTVGMGFDPLGSTEQQLLESIASSNFNYYFSGDLENSTYITQLIEDILSQILLTASILTVTDVLPDYVELVPNSFTVFPSSTNGKTITWNVSRLLLGESWSVSYQVRMYALGMLDPSPNATLSYSDYLGIARTQLFPQAYVEVKAEGELPATGSSDDQIVLLDLLLLLAGLGISFGVKTA